MARVLGAAGDDVVTAWPKSSARSGDGAAARRCGSRTGGGPAVEGDMR
jgi:hypothetical protein